jgi:hypothetical protein
MMIMMISYEYEKAMQETLSFLEKANTHLHHRKYHHINEVQFILLGLVVLGASVVFFYLTDVVPVKIENTEMSIIISLGIGLLILVVDKRQSRQIDELIKTQHKLTNEIHEMIREELTMIEETHKDNETGR